MIRNRSRSIYCQISAAYHGTSKVTQSGKHHRSLTKRFVMAKPASCCTSGRPDRSSGLDWHLSGGDQLKVVLAQLEKSPFGDNRRSTSPVGQQLHMGPLFAR
jgi:hypothetical protein